MKTTIAFFLILLSSSIFSQGIDISGHKKNIVVLGYIENNKEVFIGTGFLVEIDSIFHLVTAKHVVTKKGTDGQLTNNILDKDIYAFYNAVDGGIKYKNINEIQIRYNVDWLTHDDPLVDIAITPFEIDSNSDNLKIILQSDFQDIKRLYETYDIYFVTYHPEIVTAQDFNPIFRSGSIARINKNKTILIDAFAFPGNSGSPVFLKTNPIRFDSKVLSLGADPLGNKFIGVIGSYIPYNDVAISSQTKQPRVIFQENSGIAIIWSVDYINEILNNKKTKNQIKSIKQKIKKPAPNN